jgi:hypothetical protein
MVRVDIDLFIGYAVINMSVMRIFVEQFEKIVHIQTRQDAVVRMKG